MAERLGVAPDAIQFWISLNLFSFGACQVLAAPLVGWLVDRAPSRRGPFLSSIGLAVVGMILFMIGASAWMLVAARCLQGLSASFAYTVGLSLVADTVNSDEVGVWMGFALSGMEFGLLVAPFLAGFVYERAGYHAVFILGLAVLLFDFSLILFMIEKKTARRWLEQSETVDHSRNVERRISSEDSVAENNEHPVDFSDRRESVADTVPKASRPQVYENSGQQPDEESPLLRPTASKPENTFQRHFPVMAALLSSPQIGTALYGIFISIGLGTSFDAILPVFVSSTFHWNADGAGAIFLTLTIPPLLGPATGALTDRYGPRSVALTGLAIASPCLALLGLIRLNRLVEQITLAVLLLLIGKFPPTTSLPLPSNTSTSPSPNQQ